MTKQCLCYIPARSKCAMASTWLSNLLVAKVVWPAMQSCCGVTHQQLPQAVQSCIKPGWGMAGQVQTRPGGGGWQELAGGVKQARWGWLGLGSDSHASQ